jgi:hypothetical protein
LGDVSEAQAAEAVLLDQALDGPQNAIACFGAASP